MPWAGFELGFAALRTAYERKGFASGGNGTSIDSRSAMALGGGAGIDSWATENVAVSLEGWLLYSALGGGERPVPGGGQSSYTSSLWVAIGLGARIRF